METAARKYTLSREIEAIKDIESTSMEHRLARRMVILFAGILILSFLVQIIIGFPAVKTSPQPKTEGTLWEKVLSANAHIIEVKDTWEDDFEDVFFTRNIFLSGYQNILIHLFHEGNEKVEIGDDDWLFYSKDIEYLTGPPIVSDFSEEKSLSPVSCIVDFAEQLRQRDIELVVMPVPLKPMLYAEKLHPHYASDQWLQNPAYALWRETLQASGVHVFDVTSILYDLKQRGVSPYLKTDTHWTPEAMEVVADTLASFIRMLDGIPTGFSSYHCTREHVSNYGDIYTMMELDSAVSWIAPERIEQHPVLDDRNDYWRSQKESEILFLGDSFSNIYSLSGLGWGASGGLVEHFSRAISLPVDAIRRNDEGSIATRRLLQTAMNRGEDRLSGKKVVIWQFAMRELTQGDWRLLSMDLGERKGNPSFLTLPDSSRLHVRGTIADCASVPDPSEMTYADHVTTLHLTDIENMDGELLNKDALVYMLAIKDRKMLPAGYLRAGDRVELSLESWMLHEQEEGAYNRNELDDFNIMMETPLWGMFIE